LSEFSRRQIKEAVNGLVSGFKEWGHCCTNVYSCHDNPYEIYRITEAGKDSVEFLVKALIKEEDGRVLNGIAQILGRIKDPRAIGPLIDLLEMESDRAESHRYYIRIAAQNALLSIGRDVGKEVKEALLEAFKTRSLNPKTRETMGYIYIYLSC
jgi:hypothetical protein